MSDTTETKNNRFTSYSHVKKEINDNVISIRRVIREKGFNTKTSRFENNTMLFIVSGKVRISIEGFPEYTSNNNTIIFIPRLLYFDIHYIETAEIVTAQFDNIYHAYSKILFKTLGEIKEKQYSFPALHINSIIREYLNDVRKFITNPLHKGYKCEVCEEEFFITFGVYYDKADLAKLFFPILNNPEFIK